MHLTTPWHSLIVSLGVARCAEQALARRGRPGGRRRRPPLRPCFLWRHVCCAAPCTRQAVQGSFRAAAQASVGVRAPNTVQCWGTDKARVGGARHCCVHHEDTLVCIIRALLSTTAGHCRVQHQGIVRCNIRTIPHAWWRHARYKLHTNATVAGADNISAQGAA